MLQKGSLLIAFVFMVLVLLFAKDQKAFEAIACAILSVASLIFALYLKIPTFVPDAKK